MEAEEVRHMVIGHSQIRNFTDYQFPDVPAINFPMETICIRGGKVPELISKIKDELHASERPLRISAIIWQNSNWDITISEVEHVVFDMETFLKDYPFHRVAFPECLFVPDQEKIWDKIAKINHVLADYNYRQGFDRYPLYKVAQSYCKRKGTYTVRQTSYWEFNQGLSQSNNRGSKQSSKGYHLDEGAPKQRFAKFIRTFHSAGFNEKSDRGPTKQSMPSVSNKVFCVANPGNIMKSPECVDARAVINNIRHRNQNKPQDTTENASYEEEQEVAQIQHRDSMTETKDDLVSWIKQGKDSGYFNLYDEAVKEKILDQINEVSMKRKSQQEESESTSSKANSKKIKLLKTDNRKSSATKAERLPSDSDSSTESESSEDEMRISKITLIRKMRKTIFN